MYHVKWCDRKQIEKGMKKSKKCELLRKVENQRKP